MKYTTFLFLSCLLWVSCMKEDAIKNEIDFSNIYAITDDPDDPVQHERYLIFKDYGVSVYFNDTIAKVFVRNDVYGEPVYRYELIDHSWAFYKPVSGTDNSSSAVYTYYYTEEQEKQLETLERIRYLLDDMGEVLYPSLIMAADSIIRTPSSVEGSFVYSYNFKNLLLAGVADREESQWEDVCVSIKKEMVRSKVENFTLQVDEFGSVSETINYGRTLFEYPAYDPWWNYGAYHLFYAREESLDEDYIDWLKQYWPSWAETEPTQEHVDQSREAFAAIVGPYGFVGTAGTGAGASIYDAPGSVALDLEQYVAVMLRFSPEEFEKYFGKYTLVMRKYNILYKVIVEEMGVEL